MGMSVPASMCVCVLWDHVLVSLRDLMPYQLACAIKHKKEGTSAADAGADMLAGLPIHFMGAAQGR